MDQNNYDAVIVGGGVCGAMVALKLSGAGKSVLVLEAGTRDVVTSETYEKYLQHYYTMGAGRIAPNGPYLPNQSAISPDAGTAGTYFPKEGATKFLSDYLRILGGTTLHWQGTSVRMVPNDFQMQTAYGRAMDWPISYDDLEPYYRQSEKEIGICANVEDQQNHGVRFADGYVYPMQRMPQSLGDQFLSRRLQNASINLYGGPYPLGVVSMPVARNAMPNPKFNGGLGYVPVNSVADDFVGQRCQGNSSCTPLCPVQAKYNALKTLRAAQQAGKVEIRSQCVASKLIIDNDSGRISGVKFQRYETPGHPAVQTATARGTIVVVAANAIESAVLLLASNIVDRSGQLGRNLMDHPYINLFALAPEAVYPFRGPDTTSGVETLRDGRFREKHAAWRAGIGNWGWNGEPKKTVDTYLGEKRFGRDFRRLLHDKMTRMFKIGTMIEQLPSADNRVYIDPTRKDILGNYMPVLTYSYDDYVLDAALNIINLFWPTIVSTAGMEDKTTDFGAPGGTQPVTHRGQTVFLAGSGHLVGTHRMGITPAASVVDQNCRSWAHSNLYLAGAGNMVTLGTSNPTLTAAALSLRTADRIIQDIS